MIEVLELFCRSGGWSKGFAELGCNCTGVDVKNYGYPYNFVKADIFDYTPSKKVDIILASPPCAEFSIAKKYAYGTQDERRGLDLVYRAFEIIQNVKPKYYLVENVKGLTEFLPPPNEIIRFGRNKHRKAAYLWCKMPKLGLINMIQYANPSKITSIDARRGLIPIELSRAVANAMIGDLKSHF